MPQSKSAMERARSDAARHQGPLLLCHWCLCPVQRVRGAHYPPPSQILSPVIYMHRPDIARALYDVNDVYACTSCDLDTKAAPMPPHYGHTPNGVHLADAKCLPCHIAWMTWAKASGFEPTPEGLKAAQNYWLRWDVKPPTRTAMMERRRTQRRTDCRRNRYGQTEADRRLAITTPHEIPDSQGERYRRARQAAIQFLDLPVRLDSLRSPGQSTVSAPPPLTPPGLS